MRQLLFWIIFVVWAVFGIAGTTHIYTDYRTAYSVGSWLIPAILIGLLGWEIFGEVKR